MDREEVGDVLAHGLAGCGGAAADDFPDFTVGARGEQHAITLVWTSWHGDQAPIGLAGVGQATPQGVRIIFLPLVAHLAIGCWCLLCIRPLLPRRLYGLVYAGVPASSAVSVRASSEDFSAPEGDMLSPLVKGGPVSDIAPEIFFRRRGARHGDVQSPRPEAYAASLG